MHADYLNKNWNILAIDDSKLNRAIIKKTLKELKMSVDEATDGLEGINALKKKNYDLVLVDIIMPNLDGFGFLSQFKNLTKDKFTPVILMTGSDDLNSKIKGLSIGADDFLLKPLNEKELVARVLSLLRLKSAYTEIYNKNLQISKELEVAKKVQQFIIPKEFSIVDYPKVNGRYLPIEDIGGDYFDVYKISDNRYGFLIADVTGHGIPAALVMTMSKMIFSIYAPLYPKPDELLTVVNSEMLGLLLDYQYITGFYVIYDQNENKIYYTNAGHTRALYYRESQKKILGLDTKGLFIGISEESQYETKSLSVEKGDILFLYTDGLTELRNKNEEFGESRLASYIKKNHKLEGNNFCTNLLRKISSFASLKKRDDDIAFLTIKF